MTLTLIVTWLAMLITAVILGRLPMIRFVVQSIRSYPKEHRWEATRRGLAALFSRPTRQPLYRTPDEQAFRSPDVPMRTVPYEQWGRVDSLVVNARNVTSASSRSWAVSLDVDGSVATVHHRDETTFDIGVIGPDGSTRAVSGPEGVISADTPLPSIDNGTVAWWQIALNGKSSTLWVAQPGLSPLAMHTEPIPDGAPRPFAPYGWVLVAGDRVAWTILHGAPKAGGVVGVTAMNGTTHHLGTTRFVTLHRDVAAEREGRRVAAVNLADGEESVLGRVAQVDLDGPLPSMVILKAGAYPGASVCNGSVVGHWSRPSALQFPGGLSVPLPMGMVGSDIVSDGEWCVGRIYNPPDAVTPKVSVAELFHMPSGARQRLADRAPGIVRVRAGRVLWSWVPPGQHDGGANSWVGELRAPTPTVESAPTQAAPGS